MAVSNIHRREGKGAGLTNSTKGSAGSRFSRARGLQSNKVATASNLNFKDRINTEVNSVATEGEAIKILLPNGDIDESALSMLQDNIHQTGEMLLAKPGYNTVIEYKHAVQTLLKSLVPYLHQKESTIAPKRVNGEVRQRKFTLIYQVNQKLDTVLKIVLSSQVDQLRIMKELDEIKGLIINILQ